MICKRNPIAAVVFGAILFGVFTIAVAGQEATLEPGQQTMPSIKKMIDDMGYEVKEQTGTNEKGPWTRYVVTVPSGGRNWRLTVEISPNQENVWIYAALAKVPDPANVPRDVLERMLKLNESIGPCYFGLHEKSSYFVLYHALTNRGITPKLLRERFDLVASSVNKHESLWDPRFWSAGPGTSVPSPEVQRLIQNLGSADELIRLKAAKDLGKFGPSARAAIPALQRLLQDPDEDVRRVAATAIQRIQGGAPPASTSGLIGTTWEGSETLAGFGKLTFRFEPEGKVVMIDAKSTISGRWTQSGNQITITFGDCVYTGTIQAQFLSGSAVFTSGNNQGTTWTFSLTRAAGMSSSPVPQPSPAVARSDKPVLENKFPTAALSPPRR